MNMLTKDDLSLIAKLLDSRLEVKLESKFNSKLKSIKGDISNIKSNITNIKSDITNIKSDITNIRRDQKTIVTFFDKEYLNLRERIERIETHLGLPALQ